MPLFDLSQEGTNRDVQQPMLRGGPPMRAALANARLPFGLGDGLRLLGADAQGVSAVLVVEGSSVDLGVTELPLSFGLLEMGEGEPGVPVERPMILRWVSASLMGTTVGATDWTLRLWKRVSGGEEFSQVATFAVATQDAGGP